MMCKVTLRPSVEKLRKRGSSDGGRVRSDQIQLRVQSLQQCTPASEAIGVKDWRKLGWRTGSYWGEGLEASGVEDWRFDGKDVGVGV